MIRVPTFSITGWIAVDLDKNMSPPKNTPPQLPHQRNDNVSIGDDPGIRMLLPVGRSGLAIAAGYLGLFGFLIVPAPLALIVSILAILDIRKSRSTPKPKYGMGRAIFGLIVGILGTILLVIGIVSAISG